MSVFLLGAEAEIVERVLARKSQDRAEKAFSQIYDKLANGIGGYRKTPLENFGRLADEVLYTIFGGFNGGSVRQPQLDLLAHQFILRRDFKTADQLLQIAEAMLLAIADFGNGIQIHTADKNKIAACYAKSHKIYAKRQLYARDHGYHVAPVDPHGLAVRLGILTKAALPVLPAPNTDLFGVPASASCRAKMPKLNKFRKGQPVRQPTLFSLRP